MAKKKAVSGGKPTDDMQWVKVPPVEIQNPRGPGKITLRIVLGIGTDKVAYVRKSCPGCSKQAGHTVYYCVPSSQTTCPNDDTHQLSGTTFGAC